MSALVMLPAWNEAACLPEVVREIRACASDVDILVIDDMSDDATPELLLELGVRWLRLSRRAGVGGAVRRGLQYARSCGFDTVIRMDSDGQHVAEHTDALIEALQNGADAAVGSRYQTPGSYRTGRARRLGQRVLGFGLSKLLGRSVTDPTSGFWAFGPRAIELLYVRMPDGYSEPELRLLLHHHGLNVVEIPVDMRARIAGVTTLTPGRAILAALRALIAMIAVPTRARSERAAADGSLVRSSAVTAPEMVDDPQRDRG